MQITVALDGEKKRDLRFFAGDDMSLTIVVYEHDGDVSPITVTNVRFAAADGSLPMDAEFVVPSNFLGRAPYRIVGEVDGITTTLCYGVMQTEGGWPCVYCWGYCGHGWGIVGKAENITVFDAHQNFESPANVESALEELGDFLKSVGDIGEQVAIATAAAESAAASAQEAEDTLSGTVKKVQVPINLLDYLTVQDAVTAAAGKSLLAPPGDYEINADLTGLESIREFVNQGARFPNYSIKEMYPDSIFARANSKIASLFPQRLSTAGNYPTVVITGDSLSYNHQDFDATGRANATDCYPGLNSWSFVLRDALIRNDPFFMHGDEVVYQMGSGTVGPVALYGNGAAQFQMPFNGRVNMIRATAQAQEANFYYKHSGPQNKIYLWFLKNPLDTGCSFNVQVNGVNQVVAWNTGGTTVASPFQGRELHFVEVPNFSNNGLPQKITLTNWIGTAAAPHATNREVVLCGISSTLSNVKLTGKGSTSSKWLVDNLPAVLTSFAPDLAVVIIGANDGWAGAIGGPQTVAQYGANLETIYDSLLAANPSSQMLLISPPQTSGAVISVALMKRYINKGREIAARRGFAFLDLEDFFASTPTSVYRFDSIHFSKQGNTMLAQKVASMVLPKANFRLGYLDCTDSFGAYKFSGPTPPFARIYTAWGGSSFSFVRLAGDPNFLPVVSIEKFNDHTIKVNLAVSQTLLSNVSVKQFGVVSGQRITANPQDYYDGYVYFELSKNDGSQLVLADWTTYASSLKFIVEAS